MTAKIGLKNVIIHAPHGFFAEEHRMGNTFSIDIEVDAEIGAAASEDDLGQTVNYATIYYLLRAEMKAPTQLLETLAYRMAQRVADQFDNVSGVRLKLHKLNPPLGGKVGSSYVEVEVASSQPNGAGWDTSFNRGATFEDNYVAHFDTDGPFAGPGGGGSMTGAPPLPPPRTPVLSDLPPPTGHHVTEDPSPPPFEQPFPEDPAPAHAVTDDGRPPGDLDFLDTFDPGPLPDDFDIDDLPDFDGIDFDFVDDK